MQKTRAVEKFFDRYAANFNDSLSGNIDIETTVNSFANSFVAASPVGIDCGGNDENFRDVIVQGYDFYRSAGIEQMNIIGNEITWLDEMHAMCRVKWSADYSKKKGERGQVTFDVIYFVQFKDYTCKIFAYITGDENKVFKKLGLL